jgi:hypothetical protein
MRFMAALTPPLLLAILGFAALADARDDRIPKVESRAGEDSRALHSFTSTWTYRRGPRCVSVASDGTPDYLPAVTVARRRARPRLIFHKQARPQGVQITSYRRLDESGAPASPGRNYRPRLRRRTRGGEIDAWVARPHISVKDRLFLTLFAAWPDRSGCLPDAPEDSAHWSFALRRAVD